MNVGRAKRAARAGPAFVLMRYQDWEQGQAGRRNLVELLAMPESDSVEFEPVRFDGLLTPPDLD